MCNVCGCGEGEVSIEGHGHAHSHEHGHSHEGHHHAHGEGHDHHHDGEDLHYGHGPAHAHAPGMSQSRMVQIEQDILSKNNGYAEANRRVLATKGVFALNLVSSPGSGKTTLLTATIERLSGTVPVAVIEGDQQTTNDARRIRDTGAPAIQINTGKGCHLDAHMVGHALEKLALPESGVLFIENVGNLVCPASFDLGEAHKVAILSVTEGEDKPLKYPDMFAAADLMVLNKVDLLPHLDFDVERCIEYARRVNPEMSVLRLSARSGEGMDDWVEWIRAGCRKVLESRVQSLEAQLASARQQLAGGA